MNAGIRLWRALLVLLCAVSGLAHAQVNVTTYHNDNARTGQNVQETLLTPANVNSAHFGKLYTVSVDGYVYAQPLYLGGITINGGVHNVLYVATEHDSVYAIDADSGAVYAQASLVAAGGRPVSTALDLGSCNDLTPEVGITGTPVIDAATGTLYVVAKSNVAGSFVHYLHALDIATLKEKFGGPVKIQATVAGNNSYDSVGGQVTFNSQRGNQRAGLLLSNGHVVIAFGSHCDITPWHGWVMSYGAATLAQEAVYNVSPNGGEGAIWMSGAGPAADSSGNIFFSTGNGTWDGTSSFGDSVVRLAPPTALNWTAADYFTPYDQATLDAADNDVSGGGVVLFPTLPSGKQLLAAQGKAGTIYLLDRTNLGKFCSTCSAKDTQIVQELAKATGGIWGAPAYWNGTVYWGSANDPITAFSLNAGGSGVLSTTPSSQTGQVFGWPGPTPSVSSNGSSNGILWGLDNSPFDAVCSAGANCQVLYAYDAGNLSSLLYSSAQAANQRDVPGAAVKFATPTISNGKVYVGSQYAVSAYGLLSGSSPAAAAPTFSPAAGTYATAQAVTIGDATPGAAIYYTTNGTTPTSASTAYSGPISVGASETLQAIAVASGYTTSAVASAAYTITLPAAAAPTFSPAAGTYATAQTVTIGDATPGAAIYYTTNGTTPTTASTAYSGPISVAASEAVKAIAVASGYTTSAVAIATYVIGSGGGSTPVINDPNGFLVTTGLSLVGVSGSSGSTLKLTDGSPNENRAVWYATPVNVQSFTTDFNFQDTAATADGFTFTLQNSSAGAAAVGAEGGALGYQGIGSSVAVKFDLFNNSGEGSDSTGFYTNGASPTLPSVDMSASGVNLHSGNVMHAHLAYDGTTLTLTLTDTVTAASFTTSAVLNIPALVGGNTAYAGFTAGTGGATAVQTLINWTYTAGTVVAPPSVAATPTFSPAGGSYTAKQTVTIGDATSGATVYYTTNGTTPTTASTPYTGPITVSASETVQAIAVASGYTTSAVASAVYTITLPTAATPTFSPAAGTYATAQTVTIGDATPGAAIYYTTNGTTPTTASAAYSGPISVAASEAVKAIAVASGYTTSAVAIATYVIGSGGGSTPVINDPNGFLVTTGLSLVGVSGSSGSTLKLTDGSPNENRAVWYATPVNVQSFTTDFNFQDTAATADGFTFTLQNSSAGAAAVGAEGGALGYQGIGSSVAVKFDLFNNSGEGSDSTGFYTNGASPTLPSVDMSASGVNLHSGNVMHAHLAYDGTTLTLTLTDTVTAASFTTSAALNIPALVGGNTAYAGFTAGTGGATAVQTLINWTYTAGTVVAPPSVAATPTFSPAGGSYTAKQTVTIGDATSGATVYYTTNGTTPTTASTPYTGPITVSASETVQAIAVASGYTTSAVASAVYTITLPTAATPTFSPAAGTYATAQTVTIGDATPGAAIYYTTNGTTPTTASAAYSGPISVAASEAVKAIAVASGYTTSAVAIATYVIGSGGGSTPVINDPNGFLVTTGLSLVGVSGSSGSTLKLTDGSPNENRAVWYATPVNVQSFTTDFNFQDTAATADGFTFTLQNSSAGAAAVGAEGGALGYQGIGSSVAVKFDLFNNSGEGSDSTGFYTNGASPTLPSVDMSASGVNLHSGNVMHAHLAYDGTTLTLTLTDTVTAASFTTSAVLNIPALVGGNTAYAGFTAGTGGATAVQTLINWTYTAGTVVAPPSVAATPTFSPAGGSYTAKQTVTIGDATSGATVYYTTNGTTPTTASTPYTGPITVSASETVQAIAVASGYTTSAVASAVYTITLPTAATPTFSPAAGTYATAQTVTIGDATPGAAIYYTTNGTWTPAAALYTGPITVSSSATVQAVAVAAGYTNSAVATAAYTIATPPVINDPNGFQITTGLSLVGVSGSSGSTLKLTDGSPNENRAVWYATPVNVQSFTTDFNFQDTAATADGFTFTLQNSSAGAAAVGAEGGALGYQGIGSSVAVKFDLFNNSGEGSDSTGFYTNGASPTLPSVDMSASGVNLHSGNVMHAHLAYDGTTLTLTLTDTVTLASFTNSEPLNIPAIVGGNTAYAGFTAGTGGATAVQTLINWTYKTGGG